MAKCMGDLPALTRFVYFYAANLHKKCEFFIIFKRKNKKIEIFLLEL